MLAQLSAAGIRLTASRKAVVSVIAASSKPLTPAAIYERARSLHAGVGLATVYRTLEALQAVHCATRVYVEQQAFIVACFEQSLHVHLLCSVCHDMIECELDEAAAGIQKALADSGFQPASNAFEMIGRCARCQLGV
jgi:Fur family ferric uptake transcriptional regulator